MSLHIKTKDASKIAMARPRQSELPPNRVYVLEFDLGYAGSHQVHLFKTKATLNERLCTYLGDQIIAWEDILEAHFVDAISKFIPNPNASWQDRLAAINDCIDGIIDSGGKNPIEAECGGDEWAMVTVKEIIE